ncbi:MAG TPA: proline dehydrogenase family protein [Bryobacteraceae bacterium]|nr:proline dehydrogenase family protein [Bryobacteraceae bacterium]
MRKLLLFLSGQQGLRRWVETSRLAARMARRFVAGNTLEDALETGRRINGQGLLVTFDHLGENVTSLDEAAASREVYLELLNEISRHGLRANVSIKLTQFGMDLSEAACRDNVEQLVRRAADLGSFVRIDMESSQYTARTLALATDLHAQYGSVGTVIQSYLHRSREDVERLSELRIRVRLCKGAYLEPPGVAFQRKAEVDRNFVDLMQILLTRGVYPAIATHDERMIDATREYAAKHGVPRGGFEFQMLYGIRRDLQRKLVAEGYLVRLYVPFGRAWYPYFMRRLAERPANVVFLVRNLFHR